jgi:hypothetical protein
LSVTACVNPVIRNYVTPYCFGDATQEQLEAFSAHLLECDYCWEEVRRLEAAITILRSDPEVSVSLATQDVIEVVGISARLKTSFGGHLPQVMVAVCLYALLHPLALLAEVAYDFRQLGHPTLVAAPWIFLGMAGSSIVALVFIWNRVLRHRRSGLLAASAICLASAGVLYVAVRPLLPTHPVVQANFQTYTAQTGFLKSIVLSAPLAIPLLLVPFAAVLMLQRQLQEGGHTMVLELLTDQSRAIAPFGSIFMKPRTLAGTVLLVVALHIGGTVRLFEGLTPTSQMNLFMTLALARSVCYVGLWVGVYWWYSWAMNEIKRECVALESLQSAKASTLRKLQ